MSEKRQQHSHTVKSKKNMQKKGVLTHKVGLSYFSLSTEKGQLGSFLIKKKRYVLRTFAVQIGFRDAILETRPVFLFNISHACAAVCPTCLTKQVDRLAY